MRWKGKPEILSLLAPARALLSPQGSALADGFGLKNKGESSERRREPAAL